jgi:putative transposase
MHIVQGGQNSVITGGQFSVVIPKPGIFNSDQGSQFTSDDFISVLKSRDIRIGMDGRGRAMDNIMIERLWRSVKYEEVYLKDYQNPQDAHRGLRDYFRFYNKERIHQTKVSQFLI